MFVKILSLIALVALYSFDSEAQTYTPTENAKSTVQDIDFSKATPIDSVYQDIFLQCDKDPKCSGSDKNRLAGMFRFGDDAVFFQSKMSLDLDGSWVACNCGDNMGKYDQCNTSYFWDRYPNDYEKNGEKLRCPFYDKYFLDANVIPYIVVPGEFNKNVPVAGNRKYDYVGDLGVVIYNGRVFPVIVAETGPKRKIGEGSAALLRQIGEERCKDGMLINGQCKDYRRYSASQSALYFVFPNSKIGKTILRKENALKMIHDEALKKFELLKNRW